MMSTNSWNTSLQTSVVREIEWSSLLVGQTYTTHEIWYSIDEEEQLHSMALLDTYISFEDYMIGY